MKILLCNQYFYPAGGSETMFFKLLNFLKSEDHEIVTLGMESPKNIKIDGVKSYFTKSYLQQSKLKIPINRIFNLHAYKVTEKIIEKEKPELAHFYNTSLISPSPIIACLQHKIPVIKTFNDYEHVCPDSSKTRFGKFCSKEISLIHCLTCDRQNIKSSLATVLYYLSFIKFLELAIFRKTVNISSSKSIHDALLQSGIKSKIVYQSVYLPQKIEKVKHTKNILWAGRISKEKGLIYLIRAMKEVIKELPEANLLVAGTGKEEEKIKKIVKTWNLDKNVKFLGWLSKNEINKLYEDVDFLVMTPIWQEPFGLIGLEAMAFGKPVISFDAVGPKEIIKNNFNGFLIKCKDSSGLAKKIIELLKNKEMIEEFSMNARKKAEEFSDKRFFNNILNIYREQLQRNL